MKSLIGFFLGVTAAWRHVSASKDIARPRSPTSLMETLLKMPECARICVLDAVTSSSCSALDTTCICETPSIEEDATPCILNECSFMDALQTKNLTERACDLPVRDKTTRFNVMAITLGVITNVLVSGRLIFQKYFGPRKALSWDDYAIVLAMLIGIAATVVTVNGLTRNGMGRDAWTLDPTTLNLFGMNFYIIEVLYLAEIAVVKLSLCLFYLCIFPSKAIRRFIWATAIFNVVSGAAFVTAGIFQCTPIEYFWLRYTDTRVRGQCFDINTFGWTHAAASIAVDIWMIAIPLSQLRALQMHWTKKVGAALMLCLGTYATIVSALRLQSLIYLATSTNPTWDQWSVAWWSSIEVHVSMICTCVPTLRLILRRIAPRVFRTGSLADISAIRSRQYPKRLSIMQTKEVNIEWSEAACEGHPQRQQPPLSIGAYFGEQTLGTKTNCEAGISVDQDLQDIRNQK